MRNKFPIGLALLTLLSIPLLALPTLPQRKDMVGAYYYAWYFPGKWNALQTQLTPNLGLYQSDSMPIVIQHIDTAAYYGVDVFFMSWWNKNDVTDTYLRNGFMKAPNNNKMKFAMVIEPLGELDTLDGKRDGVVDFDSAAVRTAWYAYFQYFKDNFWSHPSYYKIDGKPVVLVYVTRTFAHFGPQYIDSVRSMVGDVYLMADEAFIGAQADPTTARNGWRNRQAVFQSYVSYNSYEASLIQPGDSAITYQRRVAMPYYQNWAAKTVFHPPLMPYYQDFRAGHPPLPGSEAQFRDIIKDIKSLPMVQPASDSLNRIYMVTSWNEWFEGTSIEPSVERGDRYCKVLREAFVEQGVQSRQEPVKIVKQTPLRIKSVARHAYFCFETNGKGNVSVRAGCPPTGGQSLILVDLGNGEVAIKDPASGKYLSLYSDGLLYPIQSYIGTWEIFTLSVQGNNIALRSKKNGDWLKASTDSVSSLVATSPTLDPDGMFLADSSTVALRGKGVPEADADPRYAVSFAGRDLRIATAATDRLEITVSDAQGRTAVTREFRGGGTYSLGPVPGVGVNVLTIKNGHAVTRSLIAPPR